MNYYGVYHQDYAHRNGSICDAPCICKGRMMLCSHLSATEGSLLAMTAGRLRNRRSLASALNCPPEQVPTHFALQQYMDAHSGDYRYETAESPVPALRSRTEDNITVGRQKMVDCRGK